MKKADIIVTKKPSKKRNGDENVSSSRITYEIKGDTKGSDVDIISSNSAEEETDSNIYSALRSKNGFKNALQKISDLSKSFGEKINKINDLVRDKFNEVIDKTKGLFLSKKNNDTAEGRITFNKGIEVLKNSAFDVVKIKNELGVDIIKSLNYALNSAGFSIRVDENGESYAEFDRMHIRKKATFNKLLIASLKHVGGQIVLTPTAIKCTKIEEKKNSYRCYFKTTDGDKTIRNEFVVNDQAKLQTYNLSQGQRYFWRLVTAVGDDWIELSKLDCDRGSDVPQAGDDIVQMGNRTDTDRQSVIILSAYGQNSPMIAQYHNVNGYTLVGKEATILSPHGNKFKGEFVISNGKSVTEVISDAKNELKGGINSQIEGLQGKVTNLSGKLEATKTHFNSEITETKKTITATKDKIDNLKVGGRNLLRNSFENLKEFTCGDWGVFGAGCQGVTNFEIGEEYVFSVFIKNTTTSNVSAFVTIFLNDGGYKQFHNYSVILPKSEGYSNFKFRVPENASSIRCDIRTIQQVPNQKVSFCKQKLEKGTISTAWNPAPEDLETKIQENKTAIEQTSKQIALKANQSEVDKLGKRVSDAELKITPDAITSVVKSNVKIGGRNLLRSSAGLKLANSDYEKNINRDYEKNKYSKLSKGSFNAYYYISKLSEISNAKFLTLSCDVISDKDCNCKIFIVNNVNSAISIFSLNKGIKKRMFVVIGGIDNQGFAALGINATDAPANTSFIVTNWKLEEGNIPTAWTPAPEDLEAEQQALKTQITQTADTIRAEIKSGDNGVKEDIKTSFIMSESGISLLGKRFEFNGNAFFKGLNKRLGDAEYKTSNVESKLNDVYDRANTATSKANEASNKAILAEQAGIKNKEELNELGKALAGVEPKDLKKALNGKTLISGGLINTELINANKIVAKKIDSAEGSFKKIYSGDELQRYMELNEQRIKFQDLGNGWSTFVTLGGQNTNYVSGGSNVNPLTNESDDKLTIVSQLFKVSSTNNKRIAAIGINVEDGSKGSGNPLGEAYALYVPRGVYAGFRRRVTNNRRMSLLDTHLSDPSRYDNSSANTIYIPALDAEQGQEYYIYSHNNNDYIDLGADSRNSFISSSRKRYKLFRNGIYKLVKIHKDEWVCSLIGSTKPIYYIEQNDTLDVACDLAIANNSNTYVRFPDIERWGTFLEDGTTIKLKNVQGTCKINVNNYINNRGNKENQKIIIINGYSAIQVFTYCERLGGWMHNQISNY